MLILLMIQFAPLLNAMDTPQSTTASTPSPISLWSGLGLDQEEGDFDTMLQEEYNELEPQPGADELVHVTEDCLPQAKCGTPHARCHR